MKYKSILLVFLTMPLIMHPMGRFRATTHKFRVLGAAKTLELRCRAAEKLAVQHTNPVMPRENKLMARQSVTGNFDFPSLIESYTRAGDDGTILSIFTLKTAAILAGVIGYFSWNAATEDEDSSKPKSKIAPADHTAPTYRAALRRHNEDLITECFNDFSSKRTWSSYIDEIATSIESHEKAFALEFPDYNIKDLCTALRTIEKRKDGQSTYQYMVEISNVLWDYRHLLPQKMQSWSYFSLGYYLSSRLALG